MNNDQLLELFKKIKIWWRNSDKEKEAGARILNDGIYDVTGLEHLETGFENISNMVESKEQTTDILKFVEKYPDFTIAGAYETSVVLLLSDAPKAYEGRETGSGFNYGSTNILLDCPRSLLILAEND